MKKLVYSHPNSMIVGSMASLLAQAGIETESRNDLLGGAAGELAPGETWIELWVVDGSRAAQATRLIDETLAKPEGEDWPCLRCQEANPETFETCWQCGAPKSPE